MELTTDQTNYYELLFHNTSDLIYELNEEGYYVRVNDSVLFQTKYTFEELKKMTCWDLIPESYRVTVQAHYRSILRKRGTSDYQEFPIITKDGSEIWISQSVHFMYEEGIAKRAFVIAKNITYQKVVELQKDKYLEGLRLLNNVKNAINLTVDERLNTALEIYTRYMDLDLGIISAISGNEYIVKYFYPNDADLKLNQKFDFKETYCDITVEANSVTAINDINHSPHKQHPCYEKFQLESYIGDVYTINDKVAGTINFSSKKKRTTPFTHYELEFVSLLANWVGSLLERSAFIKELSKSEEKYRLLSENSQDGIGLIEGNQVKYVSQGYVEMLKYSEAELLSMTARDTFELVHEEDRDRISDLIQENKKKREKNLVYQYRIWTKTGELIWVENEISRLFDESGDIIGTIVHARNITERKKFEEELAVRNERLQELNTEKDKLIAIIGHDLRNPMAAMRNMSELVVRQIEDLDRESIIEMNEVICNSANKGLDLIEEIIDWGNLTSNSSNVVEDVNIEELVSKIEDLFHINIEEKDIEFRINNNGELSFNCNPFVLELVLRNLISNAIKFTPNGGQITVNIEDLNETHLIIVKDSGVGMTQEVANSIFDFESKITSMGTNNEKGTGLGLKLCIDAVYKLGGKMEVKSELNKGSSFLIYIPKM